MYMYCMYKSVTILHNQCLWSPTIFSSLLKLLQTLKKGEKLKSQTEKLILCGHQGKHKITTRGAGLLISHSTCTANSTNTRMLCWYDGTSFRTEPSIEGCYNSIIVALMLLHFKDFFRRQYRRARCWAGPGRPGRRGPTGPWSASCSGSCGRPFVATWTGRASATERTQSPSAARGAAAAGTCIVWHRPCGAPHPGSPVHRCCAARWSATWCWSTQA